MAVSISPTLFIAGNTAYINCHIHYDFPQVTFQWLETATNQLLFPPRFTTLPNGTLIVSPIQGGDHKEISCRVSNQYGSSTVSQFITVHVHPQPSFSVSDGVIGILDDSFSFSCSGTGRPTPSLSLYTPDGGEADEAAVSHMISLKLYFPILSLSVSLSSLIPVQVYSLPAVSRWLSRGCTSAVPITL